MQDGRDALGGERSFECSFSQLAPNYPHILTRRNEHACAWQSRLRQYLCFCTSSCVSFGTFVLAYPQLVSHSDAKTRACASLAPRRWRAVDAALASLWLMR
jgi:hypothetical protein